MTPPTAPPRLLGPRAAVWAAFPFDGRVVDADGTRADWAWAMQQWDRVAGAGHAVRLVVADQVYSEAMTAQQAVEIGAKFAACGASEQLVFGQVRCRGGKLPLGEPGQRFPDPFEFGAQLPGVAEQIDAWVRRFGNQIHGIFLDDGPTTCTDPAVAGGDAKLPPNYQRFVDHIHGRQYHAFVNAPAHPDSATKPWLLSLRAEFIQTWSSGQLLYRNRYEAFDPCRPETHDIRPDWWAPASVERWSRVHAINDCVSVQQMRDLAVLAIGRGSLTVWITQARVDPDRGAVFDVLPPFWDEFVALFRKFADDEDAAARLAAQALKDEQDAKATADAAAQAAKDAQDSKNAKDALDDKDETKDAIDNKDQTKDSNDDAAKDLQDNPPKPPLEEKWAKDEAKIAQDAPKDPPEFLKDSESILKTGEVGFDPGLITDDLGKVLLLQPIDGPAGTRRTFIRPDERPDVGSSIVADPEYPEEDSPQ